MKAHYIDGKTAKRRPCELEFLNNEIQIHYVDDGDELKIHWEIDLIHKMDVRTSSCSLMFGKFPHQVVELASLDDLESIIQNYPSAAFHQSAYNKFMSFGWKGLATAVVGIIGFSLMFFFYVAPVLAEGFARTIPLEYEEFIGENVHKSYLQYQNVDSVNTIKVQAFYDQLNYPSKYDITVTVVDSDIVNAYALPGGKVVVYTGILGLIDDENQLAALLAHEVSHVNERHSLRTISRNLSTYLLLSILTGDVGGFSSVIIENSSLISSLSFSRTLEKEADLQGLKLMVESGVDPSAMVGLFSKFMQEESEGNLTSRIEVAADSAEAAHQGDTVKSWAYKTFSRTIDILSTHPSPENRIDYLKKEINLFPANDYAEKKALKSLFDQIRRSDEIRK